MLSVCRRNCLKKIQRCQTEAASFCNRPSSVFQTLAVLTFLFTLFLFHSYYSEYLQKQQQALNDIQSQIEEIESLSCKQSSSGLLKYVTYNETELTEKGLSILGKAMWSYVKPAMTSAERLTVHQLLKEFLKICDLFNITDYFLFSGSLLGSYRHHGLQPWDDDIDILMRYSDQVRILDAFNEYVNQSTEFSVAFMYTRLKLFSRKQSVSILPYRHRWPFLDMSFYHENETHIWELGLNKKHRYHIVDRSLIFPLHLRPFEGVMIGSPRDAYAVLKRLFRDSSCVPLTWIHKLEASPERNITRFPCVEVAPIYPFVHRKQAGDSSLAIEESLWVNDTLLYTLLIDEPTYAITKPYVLELVDAPSVDFTSTTAVQNSQSDNKLITRRDSRSHHSKSTQSD